MEDRDEKNILRYVEVRWAEKSDCNCTNKENIRMDKENIRMSKEIVEKSKCLIVKVSTCLGVKRLESEGHVI